MRALPLRSPLGLTIASSALLAGVAWLDYVTDWEVSMVFFYLIPVGLVSWFGAPWAGGVMACMAAGVWALDDWLMSHAYSRPVIPYWNATMELCIFLTVSFVLSSLKTTLEREKHLARTDPLTGAPNLRAFEETCRRKMLRALTGNHPMTLAFLDMDNFKVVNERFGYKGGDAILKRIAEILRGETRPHATFARLGGDEFIILYSETDLAKTRPLLEHLLHVLAIEIQRSDLPVSFSIGAVTFPRPPRSTDAMIERADAAMRAAKYAGGNRIVQEECGPSRAA